MDVSHRHGRGKSIEVSERLDESYSEMTASGDHVTVRKLAEKAGCSTGSSHSYLRKELKLFPYKVTVGQVLSQTHMERRLSFCRWILGKNEEDSNFLLNILWTDECSFKLSGHINRQNFRFWGLEKPSQVFQKPIMEKSLNVFVGFTGSRIIGPFSLKTVVAQQLQ